MNSLDDNDDDDDNLSQDEIRARIEETSRQKKAKMSSAMDQILAGLEGIKDALQPLLQHGIYVGVGDDAMRLFELSLGIVWDVLASVWSDLSDEQQVEARQLILDLYKALRQISLSAEMGQWDEAADEDFEKLLDELENDE